MSEPVKAPRKYDSSRRREQAAKTRADIVRAAQELFLDHGYVGVTIADIAGAAGVAVETIYRGFGGKAQLFKAVVEAAVAGGAERAMRRAEERPAIQAVMAETDPRRQLALYAATQPGIHARMGPLLRMLRAAAEVNDELAQVWRQLENERLEGMGRFAALLADRGTLKAGLSVDRARDVLWTLNSHPIYEQFVIERGWQPAEYERWLAEALVAALVESRVPPRA